MGRFRYGVCEWSVKARGAALCQLAADEKLDCVQLGVGEEIFCGKGLADPAVAEEYLEASEKYGVEIDSQNLYALDGTSMARYFTALADVIAGVHLKDGVGTMLSGSLLGEGTSGFYRTAGAILDNGYGGSLIIESVYDKPTVCKLGSERELLAKDAATLRRVFEK